MAKPSITTRTAKGSPLTIAEMDSNLTNLQDGFIKIAVPGTRTQVYPSGMITPSTTQKKFGDRSAQFNGTTNSFSIYGMGEISTSPWSVGMSSFCAEQFIWIDSTGTGERAIFDTRSQMGEHNGLYVYLDSSNFLKAKRGNTEIATSATALSTETWHHIAVERFTYGAGQYSSGLYLIVNGAVAGSWANNMDMFENSSQINYGRNKDSSSYFKGYMDEIRWSKSTNRYMPNMPPYTTLNPVPTAELGNDYSTSYLLHMNDTSGITDDVFQSFNLDLNDRLVINKNSPVTLSMSPESKQIYVGVDTGALVIQQFVAVQYTNSFNHNGTRQSRLDFGYNEIIDQQSFVNGMGNGIFQIQNNTSNPQNYLIEMYGYATTAATGSIELYNHTNNFSTGMTFNIVGGVIPSAAWQTNVMSNNTQQFSIGIQSGTGSETLTGGMMFLKITRV